MFGERKARSYGLRAVACRVSATLAATFFVVLILSAGPAQACPPGMNAETSAAATGVVLSAAAVQPVQIKSHAGNVLPGDLGASHSSAHGCQIGCYFACSAVVDTSTSVLQCPNVSAEYGLATERSILSKRISLLFRPPKSLA